MQPALEFPFATPPAPGDAIEVAPRLLWIRMPLPFALDHINLWLLREDDGFTLIDCGYGDAPTRKLWERHFATTLGGRRIVRIIATHGHPDHLGNAAWLAHRFGCPVAMAQAEYLTGIHGSAPVLLIDDVMGELDVKRRSGLLPLLERTHEARGQVFMTCTEENWSRELGLKLQRWVVKSGQLSKTD